MDRNHANKSTAQRKSLRSPSDIMAEADDLINTIDEIEERFKKAKNRKEPALVPIYTVGSASANSISPTSISMIEVLSRKSSKDEVLSSTGEVDLDALDRWVSNSSVEIQLKGTSISVGSSPPSSLSAAEVLRETLRKSDMAVAEIDKILETLPDESPRGSDRCKLPLPPVKGLNTENMPAVERRVTTPPSFVDSYLRSPKTASERPVLPARLPPLAGVTTKKQDIFQRPHTDMSALCIRPQLPKIKQTTNGVCTDVQKPKEQGKSLEEETVVHLQKQTVPCVPEFVLPGQVIEENYSGKNGKSVPVRMILLDYSSQKKKNGRGSKSRLQRLCKWLNCCQAEAEDMETYNVANEEPKESLNIQFETEDTAVQSLPRRIWGSIKRRLGLSRQ